MSKKGKVKMGLGDFLGTQASAASQPVKGRILPSGPDPNRDPDERRGPGGRRFDDDYDGPGARAEGADTWRRGPGGSGPAGGGGGGGMEERRGGGYDHEHGGMAPEDGTWRSRAPPPRAGGGGYGDRDGGRDGGSRMGGGGFDRGGGGGFDDRRGGGGGMGRDSGYDNPAPAGERPRLQLQSRTAPPPLPPVAAKEPAEKAAPAPAPKPSGPRSNPFGSAQAVDTTQRDREIEAKAEAAKQTAFRRRDELVRTGKPATEEAGPAEGDGEGGEAAATTGQVEGDTAAASHGENGEAGGEVGGETAAKKEDTGSSEKPAPRPMGRWAALRREGGGDDRSSPSGGSGGFPRRDRDDDRRGGGGFEGRGGRDERPSFGRRGDGDAGVGGGGGFGSNRMDREPVQPPAPPAGNAFAKRFGSNFDRDSDRSYPRPSAGGMGGGGFDRRDDDRRGSGGGGGFDRRDEGRSMGTGGGGFDRRDDDRRGGGGGGFDRREEGRGGGMGGGNSRFSREEDSGYQRSAPPARMSAGNADSGSPPSSLSKTAISEPKETPAVAPAAPAEVSAAPEPEPEVEPEPEPEEPKEDPVEVARASAAEALATGKRGAELKDFVMAQEKRTTAGALLAGALETTTTPQDMKWVGEGEFGPALTALSADNTEEQVGIIYAVVAKCHEMGFPKEAGGGVVQTIFMGMYNGDLCEEEAFIEWKDDVDNPAEGRMKAVMQTTPWFVWLEQVDEEEDEE